MYIKYRNVIHIKIGLRGTDIKNVHFYILYHVFNYRSLLNERCIFIFCVLLGECVVAIVDRSQQAILGYCG